MKKLYILVFISFLIACRSSTNSVSVKEVRVQNAAVVTAHPLASEIGLQVLKDGGNAVDAAIAVQFALAVCFPRAGNIAGGGFAIYRERDGTGYALDFREIAPKAAKEDMYLDSEGNVIPNASTRGALAVGVPGTTDGMDQLFQRFSKLQNWDRLIQPAIDLAEKGFYLTDAQEDDIAEVQESLRSVNKQETPFTKPRKRGEKFVQKEFAEVLKAIKKDRRYGFYTGWVADKFIETMENNGGVINHLDLLHYKSVWRPPAEFYYRNHRILTMPLPSSAGVVLPQMFEMVSQYNLPGGGFHSPTAIHLTAEVERRVFADRAMHLGDPRYNRVPLFNLMHRDYLLDRMKSFSRDKATPSSAIREGVFTDRESMETTHFSVVDAEGNAISLTTTLNGAYGSHLVCEGGGYFLNNEMDDFSVKPGVPNLYGLVGGEANKIQGGKRMLSSMSPTIVDYPNKSLKMVVGTPGGSTILTSVFQVITNVIDFKMDMHSAVQAPRFHHQWLPDQIIMEEGGFDKLTKEALEKKGHTIREVKSIGRVEAIHIEEDGTIVGVADKRKDDHAVGY